MTHDLTGHYRDVAARYRMLYEDPLRCRPMLIIDTPVQLPPWAERLADPMVMLNAELDLLRPHQEILDDRVPTVRVQFGTAQVAAAFGCRIIIPEESLPAAGSHVLDSAYGVRDLAMPALDAGWYGKLASWTELWKRHLPEGVHIQLPDIQSAFNSAHLIRGNDILTDFYDAPDEVGLLLDKVTDYMVVLTRHLRAMISEDTGWFYDWGALWKGAARISNCSMQMISPELYREHVLPRDLRFFDSLGGGRMHYCGLTPGVIDDFLRVPAITGLDVDFTRHDFFEVCAKAPDRVVMMLAGENDEQSPVIARLLQGDWPLKRNLVIVARAASVEAGRVLLERLRSSIPY